MLRYNTWGAKLIATISFLLVIASIIFPFLEMFAYTPLYAFVHRFSVTIEIGSFSKTLQPIFFVIPALFIKSILSYLKKESIKKLLATPLTKILVTLIAIDFISLITSSDKIASLSTIAMHGANYMLFATSSIWLYQVKEMIGTRNLRTVGVKLLSIFIASLAIFSILNAFVSVTQFVDCSTGEKGCAIWTPIEEAFPNKLLKINHQRFSHKPIIIRAPGFFGDVNFNGMFGLLVAIIGATVYIIWESLKREKGFNPKKEQLWILSMILSGLIAFGLTMSRSAMVGAFIIGILVIVGLVLPFIKVQPNFNVVRKRLYQFFAYSFLTIIILFGLGFLVKLDYKGEISTLSGKVIEYGVEMFNPSEHSAQTHSDLLMDAIKIGNTSPIFGTGLGTFPERYAKLINPGNKTASPHSTYGLIYAEQGITGLILSLGVFGYITYLSIINLFATRKEILRYSRDIKKRIQKDDYVNIGSKVIFSLFGLAMPYFLLTTITYYGFFLPMVWWWGNETILRNTSEYSKE